MIDDLPATRLATLADRYWERYLEFNPVASTALGARLFDDRLDDPTPAGQTAHRAVLVDLARQTAAIDRQALSAADRVTHAALLAQIDADLAVLDAAIDRWNVDPLEGPQILALDIPAFQPSDTPAAAAATVARWRAMGPWFDAHAENLRAAARDGRFAVRSPVLRAIDEARDTLARPDTELPLLEPAAADHPDWPDGTVERFRDDLAAAVRDVVKPALARYLAVLETIVLPSARSDERPGIHHLDDGGEAYGRLVVRHTSLPETPAALHQVGLDEVARIDDEMRMLGSSVFGTADLPRLLERLRGDPELHFSTSDEVFAAAETGLARASAAVPEWFGRLPVAECVVTRMGAHEEEHSTIAYYREPAVDGSRPGQYYINTSAPETRPRYEAQVLAYHEAVPGHHLQLAIAQELPDLPAFRRHLGPTAYSEGWALYTERLADEMGLYASDLDRIGVLSFDAWRACRLVVDTGIHAFGWTRSQAIDFMTAHTALAPNNIANEVDRYIVWPGQALAYKTGQLEFLRLRAEARAALGGRFDVRAWHDAVLGQGALGLAALREVVRAGAGASR